MQVQVQQAHQAQTQALTVSIACICQSRDRITTMPLPISDRHHPEICFNPQRHKPSDVPCSGMRPQTQLSCKNQPVVQACPISSYDIPNPLLQNLESWTCHSFSFSNSDGLQPNSFLLLVVRPGATSSDALCSW